MNPSDPPAQQSPPSMLSETIDFGAVAAQAPVAWSILDLDGGQVIGNQAYADLFGYPLEEIVSLSVGDLTHPDDLVATDAYLARLIAGDIERHEVDKRYVRKDGSVFVGHLVASLLRDDQGRPSALVGVITDITEMLRMADELVETHDRAVSLAEQRTHLIASVSHELRSPLHAILGLTELLAGTALDDDQRDLVDGALVEATRLRDRVDDLLDFARIEADGVVIEPSAVDIRTMTERLVRSVALNEHSTGLDVAAEIGPEVPEFVHIDGHRFDQILTNVVSNAVKFTDEGCVRVCVVYEPDALIVSVTDTGPGIPQHHREAVFEPFVQMPGTPAELGGAGLGLALVRAIVDLMGGSVSFADATIGTTVELRLPCETAEGADRPEASTATQAISAPVRVLVVEDNDVNQMLVRQQLAKLGHDQEIVGHAAEALDLLADDDHGFDVVLMDWQLPDIDGLEATRRIRRIEAPTGRHVPVVAVTASAMPEDRNACRDAGMDDFLPKPVSIADLAATIARWTASGTATSRGPDVAEAQPGFDASRLERLVDELDQRSVVESLVERYLADLADRAGALHEGLRTADTEVLHRVAHTLRSTSEMLGAVALSEQCREIEKARPEELSGVMLESFDIEVALAEQRLRQWVATSGAMS